MQRFRSIETLVPQKAMAYGEPIRRVAQLARAGLPVPPGFALAREHVDTWFKESGLTPLARLLDAAPGDVAMRMRAHQAREAWLKLALDAQIREALRAVTGRLETSGARAFALTVVLVCDKPEQERALGGVRLGLEDTDGIIAGLKAGIAAAFEPGLLAYLSDCGVRDMGVSLLVQRMVDGLVAGVAYTRHPVTGDAGEWLLRAGYGLAVGVRRGDVASDVLRVARDGFVRDRVVAHKASHIVAHRDGSRTVADVPRGLRDQPALSDDTLLEVMGLAARVERLLGGSISLEWALQNGRVHLLRADRIQPFTTRRAFKEPAPTPHESVLWSHRELGEAFPDPLVPLTWSLLRRFGRLGLSDALSAGGAALPARGSELVMDVRGRAYLSLSAVTKAVCCLPGVTPEALASLGIELDTAIQSRSIGTVELSRAALRLADTQVRFVSRLPWVLAQVGRERAHFAGLDTRLLSPEAMERVLCDVEAWMHDSGQSLMRCYGLWLTALLALRVILKRYHGDEALRLERDLLWGPGEVLPSGSAGAMVSLARSLARDSRARAWADGTGAVCDAPDFVSEALVELTLRYKHEALVWLDPASPRLGEIVPSLLSVLRVLLASPMALALSSDREALVRGRRERAEREWKRRIPLILWPATRLLIQRVRALTKQREGLLVDAARAVSVVREIALDASRRLSVRDPRLGPDCAFYLDLEQLHSMLRASKWDLTEHVQQRRIEFGIAASLPQGPQRFVGRPDELAEAEGRLFGHAGSGDAGEGRVVRVVEGSRLEWLPEDAVLVVRSCDVGLAPFMPCVRAVIAETGGILSHGAMLASALGVPAVVGVPHALSRLAEGERVRVDGNRARVERLGPAL